MWDIDEDRRKLLVFKKMIESLENALEEAKLIAMDMEYEMFNAQELQSMKRS